MSAIATVPAPLDLDRISLKPFPPEHLDKLWAWMHEFPKANFDDSAPSSFEKFKEHQMAAAMFGQKLIGVELDGELVGAIAFRRPTKTLGEFRGICFTKSVHGMGIATVAVDCVLRTLWAEGYEKISASYFVDNRRIHHFLKKLGAVEEGYLKAETTRNGRPVDVRRVAIFRPKEGA